MLFCIYASKTRCKAFQRGSNSTSHTEQPAAITPTKENQEDEATRELKLSFGFPHSEETTHAFSWLIGLVLVSCWFSVGLVLA